MKTEKQTHILVVDDEEHLAVGIKFNLEAEGFRVTLAGDGLSALKAVEDNEHPVDLVVLDLMLPGMSGYEVCEQIRESGKHMPVLMLSARTLTEDKTRGFDVGANQYLVKPFELEELISRVKNLLKVFAGRSVAGEPNQLADSALMNFEFGQAKIDFQTYEVTVKGSSVRLTQLQIRLLKYFIEHEGKVVPRAQLLEDVWEMPGHMNTRAPDQILSSLRKIFEEKPSKPVHFLTIRDVGYRFVKDGDTA